MGRSRPSPSREQRKSVSSTSSNTCSTEEKINLKYIQVCLENMINLCNCILCTLLFNSLYLCMCMSV